MDSDCKPCWNSLLYTTLKKVCRNISQSSFLFLSGNQSHYNDYNNQDKGRTSPNNTAEDFKQVRLFVAS
jgi:hypothetical protein